MNTRCCQYPVCFAWENPEEDCEINFRKKLPRVHSNSPIAEILAESKFKCVYDKNKNDTAEIYVSCSVLEKAFHLGVNLTDTVRDVKNHIKRLEKIPTALLHLFFNETLLRDTSTLEGCGIVNKSALVLGIKLHTARCEKCKKTFMETNGMPVVIKLSSISRNIYQVTLPLSSPVERLKELIEEKYKIYPDHQLIMFDGRKLEDDVTLEEYKVTSESDLLLVIFQYYKCTFCSACAKAAGKSKIRLQFFDNKIMCALNPEYTVRKLKETSYQYLHHIHPDLQQIFFKNQELQDEKTMKEYDIQNGAKLRVKLKFDQRKCDKCDGPLL